MSKFCFIALAFIALAATVSATEDSQKLDSVVKLVLFIIQPFKLNSFKM